MRLIRFLTLYVLKSTNWAFMLISPWPTLIHLKVESTRGCHSVFISLFFFFAMVCRFSVIQDGLKCYESKQLELYYNLEDISPLDWGAPSVLVLQYYIQHIKDIIFFHTDSCPFSVFTPMRLFTVYFNAPGNSVAISQWTNCVLKGNIC